MNVLDRIAARLGYVNRYKLPGDLANRVHLFSAYSDEIPAETDYQPTYRTHAGVYAAQVWVHRCVQLTGQALASIPLKVYNPDGEVEGHALTALVRYVNPTMSRRDLWEETAQDLLLGGEDFWELVPDGQGQPVEIWPRPPDRALVVPGATVEDKRYRRVALYRFLDAQGLDTSFDVPPEYVTHFRFRNPLNDWRGLSPLAAVRMGVLIDIYASIWSKSFFTNSARPDGVLESAQALTDSERERVRKEVALQFKGADKAHRLAILEEGQVYKPLSWPPKDIEWAGQRKMSREEICATFGVPLPLAGDLERATYENIEQARRIFWADTMVPLASFIAESITESLGPLMLAPGEEARFDFSKVAALQPDYTTKVESMALLWSIGTPANQASALLLPELGEIPGGDVGYLPYSVVPVGYMMPEPEPRAAPAPVTREVRAPDLSYGSVLHKALWRAHLAVTEPRENVMRRQLLRDFQEQQNEVSRVLRERVKGVAAEEVFDLKVWVEFFRERYEKYFADVMIAAAGAALDYLEIDADFNLRNPWVQQWLERYVFQFARRVNETTVEALRAQLLEAEKAGEDIAAIMKRITAVFDARKTRAEYIARTEMNRAANAGTLRAYEESGVVVGKQWLGALDDRIRESHREAHGQVVPIEADFEVGGSHLNAPGDPKAPAEETVNCRCTTVPVLRDELLAG